jgi:hypothetical protein
MLWRFFWKTPTQCKIVFTYTFYYGTIGVGGPWCYLSPNFGLLLVWAMKKNSKFKFFYIIAFFALHVSTKRNPYFFDKMDDICKNPNHFIQNTFRWEIVPKGEGGISIVITNELGHLHYGIVSTFIMFIYSVEFFSSFIHKP